MNGKQDRLRKEHVMNYIDRRDFVKTTSLTLGSVMLTRFRDSQLPANPVQIHAAGITVLMACRLISWIFWTDPIGESGSLKRK